jgi:alkylation response protein AidB-like acyl-CoA dehydrogenase
VVHLGADVRRLPVLAQAPAGSELLLPAALAARRHAATALRIQRLKHKLGNHANASSEVEFETCAAPGWCGEEGRGVPHDPGDGARMTRLGLRARQRGLMRQALSLALHHTRSARLRPPLIDQPLMRNVLADLALESEAAHRAARDAAGRARSTAPSTPQDRETAGAPRRSPAAGEVLDLQARQRLTPGGDGVPGRQRLRASRPARA